MSAEYLLCGSYACQCSGIKLSHPALRVVIKSVTANVAGMTVTDAHYVIMFTVLARIFSCKYD